MNKLLPSLFQTDYNLLSLSINNRSLRFQRTLYERLSCIELKNNVQRSLYCFLSCASSLLFKLKSHLLLSFNNRFITVGPSTLKALENKLDHNYNLPKIDRRYVIGCDPGLKGAIAVLDVSSGAPEFVTVFDMPLETVEVRGLKRSRIDLYKLGFLIDSYASQTRVALIEEVGFMKGKEARGSAFVFGFATGAVHGIMATCLIPIEMIKPEVWKMAMGLSSVKRASIDRAIKYFPDSAPYLKRQIDHGRAEAILLAWFAVKHMKLENAKKKETHEQ